MMRKLLLAFLFLTACSDSTLLEPTKLLYGDVQGDGAIDRTDGDLLLAVSTGSAVTPVALILACGDVDSDNLITILDAYYIYAYTVGIKRGRVGKPCL